MHEIEISEKIIGAAIEVHRILGPGQNTYVTVHGVVRAAPRPARLPNKTWPLYSIVERQPCGEGLGEGKSAKTPCIAPPARERLHK